MTTPPSTMAADLREANAIIAKLRAELADERELRRKATRIFIQSDRQLDAALAENRDLSLALEAIRGIVNGECVSVPAPPPGASAAGSTGPAAPFKIVSLYPERQ